MTLALGSIALLAFIALVVILTVIAIASITRSRGKHGTSGSLSAAALEIQSLLEPEKKRVVETMRLSENRSEDDENGSDRTRRHRPPVS